MFGIGRPGDTLEAYVAAVELLPAAAWQGLDQTAHEKQMLLAAGLPLDGAACAVSADQSGLAVRLLDSGRAVRWGQLLQRRRELDLLARGHPRLALRLAEVGSALEALEAPIDPLSAESLPHDRLGLPAVS